MDINKVFVLQHGHSDEDSAGSVLFIGVFSSEAKAKAVIELLIQQPGFKEYPEDFSIDVYTMDDYSWREGFVKVPL